MYCPAVLHSELISTAAQHAPGCMTVLNHAICSASSCLAASKLLILAAAAPSATASAAAVAHCASAVWELASRQLPFAGLHHGEIIHKVVTQDLRPSPWPAAAALPRGYVALAESCWARRVNDRPSMAQVLQALLDMLAAAEQQQVQGY
jgi:hypothetical protein